MPQQQPKTLQDYRDEKAKLQKALALPTLPDDERRWYNSAIAEIDKHIAALEQQSQIPAARPAPAKPAPGGRSMPQEWGEPIVPSIRRADAPLRNSVPEFQLIDEYHNHAISTEESTPILKITGASAAGQKLVSIDWGHGRTDTLTEGETRSRFTTALRDLAVSRMVRQQRFDDMKRYTTYARAVTYYQALTLFWGEPPTPGQLEIYPLAKTRQTIFTLIQESAGHTG